MCSSPRGQVFLVVYKRVTSRCVTVNSYLPLFGAHQTLNSKCYFKKENQRFSYQAFDLTVVPHLVMVVSSLFFSPPLLFPMPPFFFHGDCSGYFVGQEQLESVVTDECKSHHFITSLAFQETVDKPRLPESLITQVCHSSYMGG